MRKWPVVYVFLAIIIVSVLPAFAAIFCGECGYENPNGSNFCSNCGFKISSDKGRLPKVSAKDSPPNMTEMNKMVDGLIEQRKIDSAILYIRDLYSEKPDDFNVSVLLAKTLLVKCEELKTNGDKEYKKLVYEPFNIGKKLIVQYKRDYPKLAEAIFICAKSYLINERQSKAIKYASKAIKLAPGIDDHADYYFVKGDALARKSCKEKESGEPFPFQYSRAKKVYNKIITETQNNETKGAAYYKLGLLLADFGKEKEAKEAFTYALNFVSDPLLKEKISRKF